MVPIVAGEAERQSRVKKAGSWSRCNDRRCTGPSPWLLIEHRQKVTVCAKSVIYTNAVTWTKFTSCPSLMSVNP